MEHAIKTLFLIQVAIVLIGIASWGDDAIFAMDWMMFMLSGLLAFIIVILGTTAFIKGETLSKLARFAFIVSVLGLASFFLFSALRSAGIINYYAIIQF